MSQTEHQKEKGPHHTILVEMGQLAKLIHQNGVNGTTICQQWFSPLTLLHILALDTHLIFLCMVESLVFQLV